MGVVVIGDIAHVIINVPLPHAELPVSDDRESRAQGVAHFVTGVRVVDAPHDHRHQTNGAVGDPAQLVRKVPRGEHRRFAELTAVQLTLSDTFECQGTSVPAAGTSESTLVHLVVPAPGPLVEK